MAETEAAALARELERERAARAAAERQVARLGAALLDAERRGARISELEVLLRDAVIERDAAMAAVERARRVHEEMKASISWRVTAPLRAAKKWRR